jgi:coenzyme F420 hydrogenase subunit beta
LVDRVIQVRADPERPTRNVVTVSRSRAEIVEAAGSRYAASSPLEQIDQILSEGGRIAFVGKPCDCSALRQFGRHDPRVAEQIPLILSFFCAGIPSETGALNILNGLGIPPDEVAEFRYRGHGWPGRATATTHDGRSADMSYEDSWGGYLSKQVQFRCKICPDALGGVADIACADAWYGGETGYPTFEELAGRSLIMSRTEGGDRFLRAAMEAGAVVAEPLEVDQVDLMQPSQAHRKRLIAARVAAVRATLQPAPRMDGLMVGAAAKRAGVKESAHNFLGTVRRIVTGRR